MPRSALAGLGLAGALLVAPAAGQTLAQSADPACGPRAAMLEVLARRYGERPVAGGVTAEGRLIEVLASPDGATFTVLLTDGRGASCLVLAGAGWRVYSMPTPAPGEGS